MGKNDGSGKSIYGAVPKSKDCESAISGAMDSLDDSTSNSINGPIKSKDVDYPEQEK